MTDHQPTRSRDGVPWNVSRTATVVMTVFLCGLLLAVALLIRYASRSKPVPETAAHSDDSSTRTADPDPERPQTMQPAIDDAVAAPRAGPDAARPKPRETDTAGSPGGAPEGPPRHDPADTPEAPSPGPSTSTSEPAELPDLSEPPVPAESAGLSSERRAPWAAAFGEPTEGDPRLAAEFAQFPSEDALPTRETILEWLETVPGQPLNLNERGTREGPATQIQGVGRLRMPWRADVALRLRMGDRKRLQLHIFFGSEGLSLCCYERDRAGWAAYVTRRDGPSPIPRELRLTATEEGRSERTGFFEDGTFELSYRAGEMVLRRGDIVLLRGPAPGLPEAVYLDADATLLGITAVRSTLAEDPPKPSVGFEPPRRDARAWQERLPEGSRLERGADGSVTLVAEQPTDRGWISSPLEDGPPREILLRIDDATAGAGVFLGRDDDPPREVLRFLRDARNGQLAVSVRNDDATEHDFGDLQQIAVPLIETPCWLRLLQGAGVLRWWLSCDGEHWARGESPWGEQPGGITCFGLQHVRAISKARITLGQVLIRPLPGLIGLTDPGLCEQATAAPPLSNADTAATDARDTCPDGVDEAAWEAACILRTLGRGCSRELGRGLLLRLLDQARQRRLPAPVQLAALHDAWLMIDSRGDEAWTASLLQRYHDLAIDVAGDPSARPYSLVRPALMRFPVDRQQHLEIAPPDLVRQELLQLLYENRWAEVADFCRQLRFFSLQDVCPLAPWAEYLAWTQVPNLVQQIPDSKRQSDWARPWRLQTDKGTYNAIAELQAMLESGAYENAAKWVASFEPGGDQGLAPHLQDPELFVALPTAIRLARGQYPDLAAALNASYTETSLLRVRRAIQDRDLGQLELATVQFEGLPGAAEAHLWLGDRALAAGWFPEACEHFERGLASAPPTLQAELRGRRQIVDALRGRVARGTLPASMTLGGQSVDRQSLEEVLQSLTQRTAVGQPRDAGQPESVPRPRGMKLTRAGRLTGPTGRDSKTDAPPQSRRFHVDGMGRQLAAVSLGSTVYVSNRFHVTAFDTLVGKSLWQSTPPPGSPMPRQSWSLIPMRPSVTATRIYARQLYGEAPVLVCLDRETGESLWSVDSPPDAEICSDPFLARGELVALAMTRPDQGRSTLRWLRWDRTGGDRLGQHDLLGVGSDWWSRRGCEVLPLDDGVLVVLQGLTLRCDAAGRILWLRRQLTLPPSVELSWVCQHFLRPLVWNDRVFVTQPGVRTVDCMDLLTGRRQWSRVMPEVEGLIGIADQAVVVREREGLLALDSETGATRWRRSAEGMFTAAACDREYVLFAEHDTGIPRRRDRAPRLTWLDARTGSEAGLARMEGLEAAGGQLGPLIVMGDALWTFYGREDRGDPPEWLRVAP